MVVIYGILNAEGIHTDTSKTLRGAKCYATINGYSNVSVRMGYNVIELFKKVNNKWVELNRD